MKPFRYIAVFLALFVCVSCGFDNSGSSSASSENFRVAYAPASCSDADQKKFIYDFMHDAYLWRDQVPQLDYSTYSTQDDLLAALKAPEDRFSEIYSKSFIDSYYQGDSVGLGISVYSTTDSKLFIRYVVPGSPADAAGLKRGDQLITVNGYGAFDIVNVAGTSDVAYGPSTAGVQVALDYIDRSGQEHVITVTKAAYHANSVFDYNVFTNSANGKKIGYLMYNSFNENISDLDDAMNEFSRQDVKELVVDLRYNGGGLVSSAQYLASIIGGNSLLGNVLLYIKYNSSYSRYDSTYLFSRPGFLLSFDKVVFLVSGETASASELVINGLRPFRNVYLIGDTTMGKNVGMNYVQYCDSYLTAITFATSNALHNGDYASGLTPDCYRYEDTNNMRDFGDPAEKLLSSAVSYLETGSCVSETKNAVKKVRFPLVNNLGIDHSLK